MWHVACGMWCVWQRAQVILHVYKGHTDLVRGGLCLYEKGLLITGALLFAFLHCPAVLCSFSQPGSTLPLALLHALLLALPLALLLALPNAVLVLCFGSLLWFSEASCGPAWCRIGQHQAVQKVLDCVAFRCSRACRMRLLAVECCGRVLWPPLVLPCLLVPCFFLPCFWKRGGAATQAQQR